MPSLHDIVDRNPPYDTEAEQAVIGSCLLEPKRIQDVRLVPDQFYGYEHQLIWRAIRSLHDNRRPIDLMLVIAHIKDSGSWLPAMAATISDCVQSVAISAHAKHYAERVAKAATLRAIIHLVTEIAAKAYDGNESPESILALAERKLAGIVTGRDHADPVKIDRVCAEVVEWVDAIVSGTTSPGVKTGLYSFDNEVGGLFPGELAILAARTGVGKTSLACQFALHAATHGSLVYFCSIEMSRKALTLRLLCGEAAVSSVRVRTARIDQSEMAKLSDAAANVSGANMLIHDRPVIDVYEITRTCRRLAGKGLALVVVDYLGLIDTSSEDRKARDQRYLELGKITKALKALSVELDVSVLCLAQLNRQSVDGRPQLHHLRESGSIEQDADVVMLLSAMTQSEYGECMSSGRRVPEVKNETDRPWERHILLDLAKNRNGASAQHYRLEFVPERTKFIDLGAPQEYPEFS